MLRLKRGGYYSALAANEARKSRGYPMRLICPNCTAQYEVDASMIPVEGRDVQCSNCGHTWYELPEAPKAAEDDPVPAMEPEPWEAPEPDPAPEPEPEPKPEPEFEPEPEPEFEPEPEPEAEPEFEPEPEPEFTPEDIGEDEVAEIRQALAAQAAEFDSPEPEPEPDN